MTIKRSVPGAMALALILVPPALAQLPSPPVPMPLDQKAADNFSGYYQVNPRGAMRFYRENDHFYFNTVGTTQKAETVPLTSNKFAYQNGAVVITFAPGADGKVNSVTVSMGGRDVIMPRITEDAANALTAAARAPSPPVARNWRVLTAAAPRVITHGPAGGVDYWPCFSPDGKTILFSRSPNGGKSWRLYRVTAAGGAAEPFGPAELSANRPNWSPVSGKIAFSVQAADSAIWLMDGDGRNAHALSIKGLVAPLYPSWYPDGATIGFSDAASNILYRMDTRGGAPVKVTRQDQVLSGMGSVSPDGKSTVFAGQKNSGQLYDQGVNQIWVVNDRGESHPVEASPGQGRTPSWSPDGARTAFESARGGPGNLYAIFIVNRDGSGLTQVTDYALNGNHPVWSPDGKQLVFSIGTPDKENGIAVIDLPG